MMFPPDSFPMQVLSCILADRKSLMLIRESLPEATIESVSRMALEGLVTLERVTSDDEDPYEAYLDSWNQNLGNYLVQATARGLSHLPPDRVAEVKSRLKALITEFVTKNPKIPVATAVKFVHAMCPCIRGPMIRETMTGLVDDGTLISSMQQLSATATLIASNLRIHSE